MTETEKLLVELREDVAEILAIAGEEVSRGKVITPPELADKILACFAEKGACFWVEGNIKDIYQVITLKKMMEVKNE